VLLLLLLLMLLLSSTLVFKTADARHVPTVSLSSQQQRPNFIVIVTDDQGWDDIGLHNPDYVKTPNIDRSVQQRM
jgi:hypothetical protein